MSDPTIPTPEASRLDTILDDAALALSTIEGLGGLINPAVPAGAALAERVLSVLSAGVKAHERITGQPLDLSKLHHIDPV